MKSREKNRSVLGAPLTKELHRNVEKTASVGKHATNPARRCRGYQPDRKVRSFPLSLALKTFSIMSTSKNSSSTMATTKTITNGNRTSKAMKQQTETMEKKIRTTIMSRRLLK